METEPLQEPTPKSRPSAGSIAKIAAAASLTAVFVVFAAQNSTSVDVEFLTWRVSMRGILLMLCSAGVGIAVWEFAGLGWRRRRSR